MPARRRDNWPLGTGQTLDFTFQEAATKYVTLTVTDALEPDRDDRARRRRRARHHRAPSNTALPAISGTTTQGQTLTRQQRHLERQPDRLRLPVAGLRQLRRQLHQHQRRDLAAATRSTAGDVGHTIRAVVTATNAGGSTPATSAATAVVGSPRPRRRRTRRCRRSAVPPRRARR